MASDADTAVTNNADGMEDVACELCGTDVYTPQVRNTDFFLGGTTPFQMVECAGCGVLYQRPRPTPSAIGGHYPPEYQPFTPGVRSESWLRRLERRYGLGKRCDLIERYVPHGRLLDIGCATGDFLAEMRRRPHWLVAGIEPNHLAAQYANEQLNGTVAEGNANAIPFASAAFDVVTMWDVIEHVYDPQVVLGELSRLLRPGGVLVMNYPNLHSLDRQVFGRYWCGYDLPRHLYLFDQSHLQRFMAAHGFAEQERRCLYGGYSATTTSLVFLARARSGTGRAVNIAQGIARSKVLRAATMPYFKLLDSAALGSSVTTVYRKA